MLGTLGRSRAAGAAHQVTVTPQPHSAAGGQDVPFTAGREAVLAAPSCPHVTAVH